MALRCWQGEPCGLWPAGWLGLPGGSGVPVVVSGCALISKAIETMLAGMKMVSVQ